MLRYSKISRYYKVPEVITADRHGRLIQSKAIRPLPAVSGTFRHLVNEGDRLDHLAYQYYRQSRKWWRICDANPAFMSPQALLGKEPVVTERFPLTLRDETSDPAWAALLALLTTVVGVEDAQISEAGHFVPAPQKVDGKEIIVEQFERAVIVTYNQMNTNAAALATLIERKVPDFVVGQSERIGRLGKPITIPPDTSG